MIARADRGLLTDWVCSPWGADDPGVWRALVDAVPLEGHPAALARVRPLDSEPSTGPGAGPASLKQSPAPRGRATYPQPARS